MVKSRVLEAAISGYSGEMVKIFPFNLKLNVFGDK